MILSRYPTIEIDSCNYYVPYSKTILSLDTAQDNEISEAAMEDESTSGRDELTRGEASSSQSGGKLKNQKKKFDISLPAQHLVSCLTW